MYKTYSVKRVVASAGLKDILFVMSMFCIKHRGHAYKLIQCAMLQKVKLIINVVVFKIFFNVVWLVSSWNWFWWNNVPLSIRKNTLMQKLNNGSISFIFIKSCYKKTKLSVIKDNDYCQGKNSFTLMMVILLSDRKSLAFL